MKLLSIAALLLPLTQAFPVYVSLLVTPAISEVIKRDNLDTNSDHLSWNKWLDDDGEVLGPLDRRVIEKRVPAGVIENIKGNIRGVKNTLQMAGKLKPFVFETAENFNKMFPTEVKAPPLTEAKTPWLKKMFGGSKASTTNVEGASAAKLSTVPKPAWWKRLMAKIWPSRFGAKAPPKMNGKQVKEIPKVNPKPPKPQTWTEWGKEKLGFGSKPANAGNSKAAAQPVAEPQAPRQTWTEWGKEKLGLRQKPQADGNAPKSVPQVSKDAQPSQQTWTEWAKEKVGMGSKPDANAPKPIPGKSDSEAPLKPNAQKAIPEEVQAPRESWLEWGKKKFGLGPRTDANGSKPQQATDELAQVQQVHQKAPRTDIKPVENQEPKNLVDSSKAEQKAQIPPQDSSKAANVEALQEKPATWSEAIWGKPDPLAPQKKDQTWGDWVWSWVPGQGFTEPIL